MGVSTKNYKIAHEVKGVFEHQVDIIAFKLVDLERVTKPEYLQEQVTNMVTEVMQNAYGLSKYVLIGSGASHIYISRAKTTPYEWSHINTGDYERVVLITFDNEY